MELTTSNILFLLLVAGIIGIGIGIALAFRRPRWDEPGLFQGYRGYGGYNAYGGYGVPPGYPYRHREEGPGAWIAALGLIAFFIMVFSQWNSYQGNLQAPIDRQERAADLSNADNRGDPVAKADVPPGRLEQQARQTKPYPEAFPDLEAMPDLDVMPDQQPMPDLDAPPPALPRLADPLPEALNDKFFLQIGAYSSESAAKHSSRSFLGIAEGGYALAVKALIGPFDTEKQAERALRQFPGTKKFITEGKNLHLEELFLP